MARARQQHAVMRQMPRIFLTCRALGRYLQVFSPDGAARGGRHRVGLGACLVADAATWWAIRTQKVSLPARVALDAAELAYWSGVSPTGLQGSLASHISEHIEAGFSWGAAGFAIPLLDAGVSTLARTLTDGPREPAIPLALSGAVLAGGAVREVEQRRLGRARDEYEAELSARRGRSFLAGQNAIGMGASSVVDLLSTVAALLGTADAGSALFQVRAGWKASLAEQTQRHAVYLDQAVRVWEQLHNQHPDLMSDVDVVVPEGVGTTLLSGPQAVALGLLLDERNLRGRVEVDVAEKWSPQDRLPGRPVELIVNGTTLLIPADPSVRLDEFNAAPPTFLFAAFMALIQTRKSAASVPPAWAALTAAVDLAAAGWFLDRPPRKAAGQQLLVGLATAVLQGGIFAAGARNRRTPAGAVLFPGTYGIAPVLLLLSANWHRLPRQHRAAALVTLALIAIGAYYTADDPKGLSDLVSELVWPVAALVGSTGVTAATEEEAARLLGELDATREVIEAAAFEEGRASVLALVCEAVDEAGKAFRARKDLDPDVADAIANRLDEIRVLLARLQTS